MGAGGSTRRLSIKNDEPHIIEVTNDVVERLKTGVTAMEKVPPTPPPPPPPPPPAPVAAAQSHDRDETKPVNSAQSTEQPQEKVALSVGSSGQSVLETVSALQVRQEKDVEINANDLFWRTKLKELEARYVTSAFASEKEFNTELEKLTTLFPKKRGTGCRDISAKVAECYASNPTQTLRCSQVVKEFAQCVENMNLPSRSA